MERIDPALAGKILAASDRNLVKHVGEGGRLSPSERDQVAAHQVTALTEDELKKARAGALMLKWSKGQRLSKEEREELNEVLPSSRAEAKAQTASTYKQTMKEYGKRYDVSDRAVKAWIRDGRSAAGGPDLPPLDEPEKMAGWYARVKKRRVPAELLRAAQPANNATAPAPSSIPLPPVPAINVEDFGYDLAVRFAAENLSFAQDQLRKARTNPENLGRIEECERSVTRALSEYRKAKGEEKEHLGSHNVDRRTVLALVQTKLTSLHQGVRSIPVRVGTKLALSPEQVREIIRAMNEELDVLFAQMRGDRWIYKETLTLQPA